MQIRIKRDRTNIILKDIIKKEEGLIVPELENIYQNSPGVRDLIMEISKYEQYGCRVTSLFRSINQQLSKVGHAKLSFKELDDIADSGGAENDAWSDDYKNPIYNIINTKKLVEKINTAFKVDLKYELITRNQFLKSDGNTVNGIKDKLKNFVVNNIPLTIKMQNLTNSRLNHFVNVIGFVVDKATNMLYFRMKETYANYNGYNEFYVEWYIPEYYEIIYL